MPDLPALRRDLSDIVGPDHVLTGPDERARYETDWTGRFRGSAPAVVRPGHVDEVAAVVGWCRENGVALVPQGGNTGLVGGSVPLAGELVLSLVRMSSIGPVDTAAGQVTVGAGAVLSAVDATAAGSSGVGLRYAVDFAARDTATAGGTIATNAGGMNVVRYGATREQVIGVEAVLGSGEVISHLQGLVKDNTGYHFPSLLCGSEGTLGIVTAARLRLVARYRERVTALVGFRDPAAAVAAVGMWRAQLDSLEAAELFLCDGLALVCDAFDLPLPFATNWPAYLLVEAAGHRDPTDDLAAAVASADGVADVAVATDEARRAALWRYREDHTLAINTLGPPHKLDVTLPAAALAEFLAGAPARVGGAAPASRTWLFGHLGDGNIHVNVTGVPPDDERVDDAVLRYVAELGGSISAEHGIGTAKRRWLHLNRSAAEVAAMRAVKRALDPDGVLNPNVLLPPLPAV